MKNIRQPLVLSTADYDIICNLLKYGTVGTALNRSEAEGLRNELSRASLLRPEEMPMDVIRLNTEVIVEDETDGNTLQLTVVTPSHCDIKKGKISVLSPVGTALIGYRKGDTVSWQVPKGIKTFFIVDVRSA
jgi:regulator of nucleoside diphosphate kinase